MGFLSQAGHFGVKTQTTMGAFANPGAVAPNQGVFPFYRSGALGGNRELLIPDPEIGAGRDIPDAQLGPIAYSGEYDMYLRMESAATFLRGVMGAAVTTGAAGTGYTHTITGGTVLPWMSIEEKIGNGYETFAYTDGKVNTFHLEADANGYLMSTVGMIALSQATTSATIIGSQRRDISPLIVGSNITVAWGGVQLPAKSFSLDVNNNLEDDDFRLGSLFLGALTEKRREITMGVTIRPEDSTLWKTATWGSPGATAPLGQSYKDDVTITIASYEDIPGASAGVKYSMIFTIPFAIIAPFQLDPSGDDVMEHDLEIRPVLYTGTEIMTTLVKNSYATIA